MHQPNLTWLDHTNQRVLILNIPTNSSYDQMTNLLFDPVTLANMPKHDLIFVWNFAENYLPLGPFATLALRAMREKPANIRHSVFINAPEIPLRGLIAHFSVLLPSAMRSHIWYYDSWADAEPHIRQLADDLQ